MATPVTQYTSPDPSFYANPDFGQFRQFLITGTNYIVDDNAQIVYEFNPAVPGVLTQTAGSYTQFLAYLAANPVTSSLPNPNGPPGGPATFGFPYNFQSVPAAATPVSNAPLIEALRGMMLELRCVRLAVVALATNSVGTESDFDPTILGQTFAGTDGVSFN